MTTDTAALAEALVDFPDAPRAVRDRVGAELLYALGIRPRPVFEPEEGDTNG